ncbi:energy coupling factor transporter S component ThiW [Clostridium sp. DSM 8431]|uniref:energy coupling factor transporter S component ThiW n=1 Tax=Clostridium sp. DSM 8431 TaxID=1761781 RepID=UPI0008E1C881|nr:energy coupling factor transporter S component ThiW [Clostridium sp. DSM 8431]SFU74854.1 energy coupling factor transporter S component ThiW [Clostridium sp. DSM 8431]
MDKNTSRNVALSGVFIAIAVVFGTFSIPVIGAKMSPVQHFINIVSAVTLGPSNAVLNAFVASLLRNILGTGSLLAFPGSMVGALISGLFFKKFKKIISALIGEVIGTGILGALLAYPVAVLLMGKESAIFVYIIPFLISCSGGAVMAYIFLQVPVVKKVLVRR